MANLRPSVLPEGLNPMAIALRNIFEEFRDTPRRISEQRAREMENVQRAIDLVQEGLVTGGDEAPVPAEASAYDAGGRRIVGEGPSTTVNPPATAAPRFATLRPRGRALVGGEGLELVGEMLGDRVGTPAERRPTYDAIPSFSPGDVRQPIADVVMAAIEEEAGRRLSLPYGMGQVTAIRPDAAATARIARTEVLEGRQLDAATLQKKVETIMAAARAQGEPISEAEARAAAQGLNVPEDEQAPWEQFGLTREEYLQWLKDQAAATRAPTPTTANASAQLRRANNLAVRLVQDENMTLNQALVEAERQTGTPPDYFSVQKALRGVTGDGEIPLSELQVWAKEQWDRYGPEAGPRIIEAIENSPDISQEDKDETIRYVHELAGRNMPVRGRQSGFYDRAAAAHAAVVGERRGEVPASDIDTIRQQINDLRSGNAPFPQRGMQREAERQDTLRRFLQGNR